MLGVDAMVLNFSAYVCLHNVNSANRVGFLVLSRKPPGHLTQKSCKVEENMVLSPCDFYAEERQVVVREIKLQNAFLA